MRKVPKKGQIEKRPERAPKKGLPTREELLTFLAEHADDASKRDIAKAFGIKGGAEKIALKRLLKDLTEEGVLTRQTGKRLAPSGALPEILAVEIIDRDADGELICRPAHWTRTDDPPKFLLAPGEGGRAGDTPALGIGERFLARLSRDDEGVYLASVIRRLGQSAHRVLGIFRKVGRQGRIEPVDRKARFDLLVDQADTNDAADGDLVLAEPLAGRALGLPRARIVERKGSMNAPKSVSLIAIYAHGIPTDFPQNVLREAERAKPADMSGREDLRRIPLVTIDPKDARDHDDAVYAEPDPDPHNPGGFKAVVAIADVAHYVQPASTLDKEARKRGNSVYFPDRVVPMLPEALSGDLCSLKEGVERPILAVYLTIGADGKMRGHRFVRAMMRSAARLSYEDAQAAIDGHPTEKTKPLLKHILEPLWACYRLMAKARDARSPLDLDVPEHRIELSPDGRVTGVSKRARLEAHRLIEEFMIQANVAAAETLNARRTPLIYRIHDQPSVEKLAALSDFLKTLSMTLPKGQIVKTEHLNRILKQVEGSPHHDLVNEVVLRAQAQAAYDPANIGHFGLNLRHYAHFTSPIRRYADLIVHRALIRALSMGEDGLRDYEAAALKAISEEISVTERRAMAAERDSTDRYMAAFMSERIGAEFPGRISGVTRFGLFVRLLETGADGLIPIRSLGEERFHHDERAHALIGERSGLTFRLGDVVTVSIAEAAPVTGGLRFALVQGGKSGAKPKPAKHPQRKSSGRRR